MAAKVSKMKSGDTDAKRLSRLAVYRRIEELQPAECRDLGTGTAIVLAGPEAGEVGCLRDFLKMEGMQTFFVDIDHRGILKTQKKWPQARTFYGEMGSVLSAFSEFDLPAALINFDFCGYVTEDKEKLVKSMAHRVMDWGMVFYTFFRGRETWKHAERVKKAKAKTLDGKRFVSTAQVLQKALGPSFLPVFSLRYSGSSKVDPKKTRSGAMGILGFQKVPKGFNHNKHWQRMVESPSPYGGVIPSDKRLLEAHLRVEALSLRKRGLNSKEVASILNLEPGSVAAWFAGDSRK